MPSAKLTLSYRHGLYRSALTRHSEAEQHRQAGTGRHGLIGVVPGLVWCSSSIHQLNYFDSKQISGQTELDGVWRAAG